MQASWVMNTKEGVSLFIDRFQEKKTTTWASSLAYYTALSLAPLLMLFLLVTSQFGYNLTENFVTETRSLMGSEAASAIEAVIKNAQSRPDLKTISGLVSVITLMLSASFIFGQVREALNFIFDFEPQKPEKQNFLLSAFQFLRERVFQMGLVLGFLATIIGSLIVSAMISSTLIISDNSGGVLLNILISTALYVVLFSMLYHFLPDRRIPWKVCLQGGLITATLFVIGKELIGIYLGRNAFSSTYGAAGSILVLLVWVYYSALIIFVGAHVIYILSKYFRTAVPTGKY